MRKLLIGAWLALSMTAALAAEAQPTAANPELEKRVMAIAEELRCLVCQNQTIADSHADLAIDLKNQVREKLQQGMSDKDVIDYMVQRYGDFVRYRPPVKTSTWLLWFGPFVLLVGGIFFLVRWLRRGRAPVEALPEADMRRAADMLRETPAEEVK